jgi:hypothetical protein
MNQWQEKLSKFYGVMFEAGDFEELQAFIETEIIEKIIDDIPEHMINGYEAPGANIETVKSKLRNKYLTK